MLTLSEQTNLRRTVQSQRFPEVGGSVADTFQQGVKTGHFQNRTKASRTLSLFQHAAISRRM
jgi:hypothetical protein